MVTSTTNVTCLFLGFKMVTPQVSNEKQSKGRSTNENTGIGIQTKADLPRKHPIAERAKVVKPIAAKVTCTDKREGI